MCLFSKLLQPSRQKQCFPQLLAADILSLAGCQKRPTCKQVFFNVTHHSLWLWSMLLQGERPQRLQGRGRMGTFIDRQCQRRVHWKADWGKKHRWSQDHQHRESNPHLRCEAGTMEACGLGADTLPSQPSPFLLFQLDTFVKVPW